jgi:H+/Cl- antiporter ClcA
MLFFWIVLAVIVAALVWYALAGRAWLKKQPWAQSFFSWIEPLELALFKKSETILIGRVLWVGGLFVTAYDTVALFIGSLDLTPLTTRVFDWLQIPPDMRNLSVTAFIGIIGLLINWLRKRTTKPLELVATSESSMTPGASIAVAKADVAKDQAVQAVEEAKS